MSGNGNEENTEKQNEQESQDCPQEPEQDDELLEDPAAESVAETMSYRNDNQDWVLDDE